MLKEVFSNIVTTYRCSVTQLEDAVVLKVVIVGVSLSCLS